MICICPVVVYPKSYVDSLQAEVNAGRRPVFSNIDAMFAALDNEA